MYKRAVNDIIYPHLLFHPALQTPMQQRYKIKIQSSNDLRSLFNLVERIAGTNWSCLRWGSSFWSCFRTSRALSTSSWRFGCTTSRSGSTVSVAAVCRSRGCSYGATLSATSWGRWWGWCDGARSATTGIWFWCTWWNDWAWVLGEERMLACNWSVSVEVVRLTVAATSKHPVGTTAEDIGWPAAAM